MATATRFRRAPSPASAPCAIAFPNRASAAGSSLLPTAGLRGAGRPARPVRYASTTSRPAERAAGHGPEAPVRCRPGAVRLFAERPDADLRPSHGPEQRTSADRLGGRCGAGDPGAGDHRAGRGPHVHRPGRGNAGRCGRRGARLDLAGKRQRRQAKCPFRARGPWELSPDGSSGRTDVLLRSSGRGRAGRVVSTSGPRPAGINHPSRVLS